MRIDQLEPNSSMFICPSSYTLNKINMVDDPANSSPCILRDFCVTDKADGDRKMLFISTNSKIYFITSNMNIQYTGAICRDPELINLILDGEHILYDKRKKYINLYASFDIYYLVASKKPVHTRLMPFIDMVNKKSCRYGLLMDIVQKLKKGIEYQTKEKLDIISKTFAISSEEQSIQ